MNSTDLSTEKKFVFGLLCVFAVLILTGAFVDWDLAVSLYTPRHVIWGVVTNYGQLLFYLGLMLFFGVLSGHAQQVEGRSRTKALACKLLWAGLACAVAWATKKSAFKSDILFGFLADQKNTLRIVCMFLFYVPVFGAGYFFRIKDYTKEIERRLIILVGMSLAALASAAVLKNVFSRPRPYKLFQDTDAAFVPWFQIPVRGLSLAAYPAEEAYYSFPSAHAISVMPLVCFLPALTLFIPKLRPYKIQLAAAGLTVAVLVIASRMILGSHFLSDVSTGAVISLLFLVPYVLYKPFSALSDKAAAAQKA
ncbi:MAG: phosphatase PAP2 family protein [Erysipelotrichaceae bacterium]|nr:phosphatase PAP2 family protein [Erysipelotrichaceae bacterium]